MAKEPDSDIVKLHQDADLIATGLKGTSLHDGFSNHGIIHPKFTGETHSIGIKPHPHGQAIARQLLAEPAVLKPAKDIVDDPRPLIDILHEATFGDTVSMQFVSDKYALRGLLRKAHCFTLDSDTSALVTDFAFAIATDLEAVRQLAIPPFPVTWVEVDNIARLGRCKTLGLKLTQSASGEDVCRRIGWLITPATLADTDGYYVTYCAVIGQGAMVAPLSLFWRTGEARSPFDRGLGSAISAPIHSSCFGMDHTNVSIVDAFPSSAPFQLYYNGTGAYPQQVHELMKELRGELRYVWGLLLALGAGHLGAQTSMSLQPLPVGPHPVAKGKPLLPLEHKVLTIKLAKRTTVQKVAMRAITGIKHRWHEVRGHFRTKYNADGSVKWRIPIKPHARGDERLGKIEKTYRVER